MNYVNCFDVVSMVVDEATAQFTPIWKINNDDYRILQQYCRALDALASEFDGETFEVSINDDKTVSIMMECEDMTIKTRVHDYYELAQRAVSFGFSVSEDGDLVIEFVFPSVWEKAV